MSEGIIGLFNPAIAVIFAAIFFALWHRDRSLDYVLAFALGYVSLAIGFLIFHYTTAPDHPASILSMHLFYGLTMVFLGWGACKRIDQNISLMAFATIIAISGALMVLASYADNMNARLYAANAAYGAMTLLAAQILTRTSEPTLVNRALAVLFMLTAAQFFIRPMVAITFESPVGGEDYRTSIFYAIVMVTVGLSSLLLALALIAAVASDHWNAEREAAEYDHLTGLRMRGAFEQAVTRMLDENADRRNPVSMIVADIDHFKKVNDIWGHQAGDEAIASFGQLIAATVRNGDICGRIGGEEFCILVWNCEGDAAARLADRLRKGFSKIEHEKVGDNIHLTASFGVAQWREGEGYGKLFARADAALYTAKNEGRDRVHGPHDRPEPKAEHTINNDTAASVSVLKATG